VVGPFGARLTTA